MEEKRKTANLKVIIHPSGRRRNSLKATKAANSSLHSESKQFQRNTFILYSTRISKVLLKKCNGKPCITREEAMQSD
ncbi:hypothetical protein CEXT_77951 [Caerostris extrusa]|uniref:Uncharacterized protein n=1 Tax=Caerostris extrusa TaxID=172846 RepID=A0AAV4N535_CAEEX|nr:hypothetical protein CEXT_77951 [Caerostris extrusa]